MQSLIDNGVAAALLASIVIPAFRWMKKKIDVKDKYIEELVTTHLKSDVESRVELKETLQSLNRTLEQIPQSTLELIKKNYPPRGRRRTDRAAIR